MKHVFGLSLLPNNVPPYNGKEYWIRCIIFVAHMHVNLNRIKSRNQKQAKKMTDVSKFSNHAASILTLAKIYRLRC